MTLQKVLHHISHITSILQGSLDGSSASGWHVTILPPKHKDDFTAENEFQHLKSRNATAASNPMSLQRDMVQFCGAAALPSVLL